MAPLRTCLAVTLVTACTSTRPAASALETGEGSEVGGDGTGSSAGEPGSGAIATSGGSSAADATNEGSTGAPPSRPEVPLAYVRRDPYPRLVIELDAVAQLSPYADTQASIVALLDDVLDKPAGIDVVFDEPLLPGGDAHAWTPEERFALGEATFDLVVPEDTIKIHVMFLDGHAAEDDVDGGYTLGHAWDNRHAVIYKQRVVQACEGLGGALQSLLCERTELLLLQHEIGHVLGLVDFGLPMQSDHRDPRHGPHDIDPACVMYWSYDGLDLVDAVLDELLMGAPPLQLDAACLADIEAARRG